MLFRFLRVLFQRRQLNGLAVRASNAVALEVRLCRLGQLLAEVLNRLAQPVHNLDLGLPAEHRLGTRNVRTPPLRIILERENKNDNVSASLECESEEGRVCDVHMV